MLIEIMYDWSQYSGVRTLYILHQGYENKRSIIVIYLLIIHLFITLYYLIYVNQWMIIKVLINYLVTQGRMPAKCGPYIYLDIWLYRSYIHQTWSR